MKKYLAILFVLSATGCGFEPLYAEKKGYDAQGAGQYDASVVGQMAQVKVEPISERFGQVLRNHLLDKMTPNGVPTKPSYRLYTKADEPQVTRQAMRGDITATREMVKYSVQYRMVDSNSEELFKGDSLAYVSYDILDNPYSTTLAKKKAEQDAAKIIADDMSLRVGSYFHSAAGNR